MLLGTFLHNNQPVVAIQHQQQWLPIEPLLAGYEGAKDTLSILDQWPVLRTQIKTNLDKNQWEPLPDTIQPSIGFEVKSLRDFMLSEQHAINSARGMAKRFMPAAHQLVYWFEKTGKTFPALKPKPIWYRQPIYYFSNHLNLLTDGDSLSYPSHTQALDYELELAFVLTKPLQNATEEEALAAIGGFMVLNDFSGRDIQVEEMRSGFGPQGSKHFVNGLSHTIATADEVLPRINSLLAKLYINNELICSTSSADMHFSVAQLLVAVSKEQKLHPGEVFGLGTMPYGCALENGHWLKPGDTIKLEIDGVGSLTNRIE